MESMDEFNDVVAIPSTKELKKYLKPLYVIEEYTRSEEDYKDFQEKVYNYLKGCFEHKECREYPVKFKFYLDDKETYTNKSGQYEIRFPIEGQTENKRMMAIKDGYVTYEKNVIYPRECRFHLRRNR